MAHIFSALDQKKLDALIVQWNKDSPSYAFFCRPHSSNSDDNKENDNDSRINAQEDTPPDEVPDPAPSASEDQTLLFCHQTVEQRELLKKYGDQMCLMDATYRTTKYALPLYFLCVRTNVRYQVVGSFVIQYENTRNIEEALNVFKKWNQLGVLHILWWILLRKKYKPWKMFSPVSLYVTQFQFVLGCIHFSLLYQMHITF